MYEDSGLKTLIYFGCLTKHTGHAVAYNLYLYVPRQKVTFSKSDDVNKFYQFT
jgi:hypothetical protein